MSEGEDTERATLNAVAGVSRTRPAAEYRVEGLSFGAATLARGHGDRWGSLTLTLTAEAASHTTAPTATTVRFDLGYWASSAGSRQRDDAEFHEAVRSLLLDHHLLSRPGLLAHADGGPPVEGAAAKALLALRDRVEGVRSHSATCPVCDDLVASLRHRYMEGQLRRGAAPSGYGWRRGLVDCAHAPMRGEAFAALLAAHPELAFEAAGVLRPASALDPPRFALSHQLLAPMLGHWLMRRGRSRYGYVDDPFRYGRGGERQRLSRVPQGESLSVSLRGALHFAAQSWGASGPLEGFAPPTTEAVEATPTMTTSVEPLDVSVMWPEGVARPAEKEPAKKEPAAVKKPAGRATKKATEALKPEAGAPSIGQMLMTAELRALGYSDAKVKSLLAAGTIERAGYGWFRWKG